MELFHLRYFVAVAENLSFSKAARGLHMATSPLSQRVRDLERELGASLFDRDSHSVRLTRAGSALLPIAKDVVSRFDDIPWRLRREVSAERRHTVFIGIPPGLHLRVREKISELEQRCREQFDIKRWPGGSGDLLHAVQRGELAMALAHLPVDAAGISMREVMREPLGAVLPVAEFGSRESVSLTELVDYAYVSPAPGTIPTYFEQLEVRLAAAGIKKRIHHTTADYGSTSEIVANGSAFAVSMLDPESSMHKHRSESVVLLPFNDFRPTLATGLIWRTDRGEDADDLLELVEQTKAVL
jgi:DNA-binding transcriptional LysR family regulator